MDDELKARSEAAEARLKAAREARGLPQPRARKSPSKSAEARCGTQTKPDPFTRLSALIPQSLDLAGCPPELLPSFVALSPEDQQKREATDRRQRRERLLELWQPPIKDADYDMLAADALAENVSPSLRIVREWLAGDKPWLLLLGTTGRGKTLAALWACLQRRGTYVRARELERVCTARYGEEVDESEQYRRASFLVIDDVGTERDAANMTAALYDMVDCRRGRAHRSILVANMTPKRFRELYRDDRLLSRLDETDAAEWKADAGKDLRRAK